MLIKTYTHTHINPHTHAFLLQFISNENQGPPEEFESVACYLLPVHTLRNVLHWCQPYITMFILPIVCLQDCPLFICTDELMELFYQWTINPFISFQHYCSLTLSLVFITAINAENLERTQSILRFFRNDCQKS